MFTVQITDSKLTVLNTAEFNMTIKLSLKELPLHVGLQFFSIGGEHICHSHM